MKGAKALSHRHRHFHHISPTLQACQMRACLCEDLQGGVQHALLAILVPAFQQQPGAHQAKALRTLGEEDVPLHLRAMQRTQQSPWGIRSCFMWTLLYNLVLAPSGSIGIVIGHRSWTHGVCGLQAAQLDMG